MMDIVVTTHYATDDPECGGDYYSVDIEVDGVIVEQYGDHYHDKGYERADGYTDALMHFFPEATIRFESVADAED